MSQILLLLVDLQKAIDHPNWGRRNNPLAEIQIARLLDHWRSNGWPVWHIRRDSTELGSHYRPGQGGHDFKPEAAPVAGEPVIPKRTNNAFIGTNLDTQLRAQGHETLMVVGVITNMKWATRDVSGSFVLQRAKWKSVPLQRSVQRGGIPCCGPLHPQAANPCYATYGSNPYRRSGLSTRIACRSAASPTHSPN
jgi:hypothetical protein